MLLATFGVGEERDRTGRIHWVETGPTAEEGKKIHSMGTTSGGWRAGYRYVHDSPARPPGPSAFPSHVNEEDASGTSAGDRRFIHTPRQMRKAPRPARMALQSAENGNGDGMGERWMGEDGCDTPTRLTLASICSVTVQRQSPRVETPCISHDANAAFIPPLADRLKPWGPRPVRSSASENLEGSLTQGSSSPSLQALAPVPRSSQSRQFPTIGVRKPKQVINHLSTSLQHNTTSQKPPSPPNGSPIRVTLQCSILPVIGGR
ncbi:hypothetical protein G7Z17_g9998 [Cylindrodendrum hubeiense]|uniref:Uncharacterized protein n=1 Tax=Cylindrodendrum hubeiense TaxID=595255 RepID=A0A9P5LBN3_9HYPO|nr:hypothetical protein G7Z17_g9998 [Cylindrodendrum hubeiense]